MLTSSENYCLHLADCLQVLPTLAENSVDLIVTDPPYFRVKANAWGRQWDSATDFLAWMDSVLTQFWRLLKPNGSLYLFCSPGLSSETELLIKQRFHAMNHIVWRKPSGRHKACNKESLRHYFPQTERIIFAEHYGAEGYAKGDSGYAAKCAELKQNVFAPLIDYFKAAKAASGISNKEINAALGSRMAGHWFTESQWALPSQEQYAKLQELFSHAAKKLQKSHAELREEYTGLHRRYCELRTEYQDLRAQYEALRRPFAVTKEVPYTDVWDFKPVEYYPGKHPCEKPQALLEHAIAASSRPGDVVLDAFAGSGATGVAALKLGRQFVGIEMEEGSFAQANERLRHADPKS